MRARCSPLLWTLAAVWLLRSPAVEAQARAREDVADAGVLPAYTVHYAEVARISLDELDLPRDSSVALEAGVAEALTVADGEIRFVTPSDPGADQQLTLRIRSGGAPLFLPVIVASDWPTAISEVWDADEEGRPPPRLPPLRIEGLGPRNLLTEGAPLVFRTDAPAALDPELSQVNVWIPSTKQVVALSTSWRSEERGRALVLPAATVAAVWKNLPSGELELDITLNTVNDGVGGGYKVKVLKATATLEGKIVDRAGQPVRSLAGRRVGIRGLDSSLNEGTRLTSTIARDGSFRAGPLAAGTYAVALLDTAAPGFTGGGIFIRPEAKLVSFTMVHSALPRSQTVPSSEEEASPPTGGAAPQVRQRSPPTDAGARQGSDAGKP